MSHVNEQSKRRRLNKKVKEFFAENIGASQASMCQLNLNAKGQNPIPQVDSQSKILKQFKTNSKGENAHDPIPQFDSHSKVLEQNVHFQTPLSNEEADAVTSSSDSIKKTVNPMSLFFSDENVQAMFQNEIDVCQLHDDNEEQNISDDIAEWATKFKISIVALSALLLILRLHKLQVPKDARTLLKTPLNYSIQCIAGGDYFYNGVKNSITSAIKRFGEYFLTNISLLHLQLMLMVCHSLKVASYKYGQFLDELRNCNSLNHLLLAYFLVSKNLPLYKNI